MKEESLALKRDQEIAKIKAECHVKVDVIENLRVKEEKKYEMNLALLKKEHEEDIDELCKEQEKFVSDLLDKHERKIMSLKQEIGAKKKSHAYALNAYMSASCSALKLLRGVSPSKISEYE